ncbi:MAG: LuxR C-terminal-related transcriptional regulator [Anaerolineae bacterium]|jgi:PAS domain S-box-containing protein
MNDVLFQALANTGDGAFVTDADQRIIFWNQAARQITGYSYEEVSGLPCYELLEGRDDQDRLFCSEHCRIATAALRDRAVKDYDILISNKSDKLRWINLSTLTFPANGDSSKLILHSFRDVTRKKQYEQLISHILKAARDLQNGGPPQAPFPAANAHLTNRELEVLSLLAQGFSTDRIARSLFISSSTARNHIRNILQKLQVHSRLEAVVQAYKLGLVSDD